MKIVVSHPTGNRNVRAIISSLFRENMLAEFNTTIAADPDSRILDLLPASIKQEALRRTFPVPLSYIHSNPWRELSRLILPKVGLKRYTQKENGYFSVDSIYNQLDKDIAGRLEFLKKNKQASAIYAYEDGALASFKRAKELGMQCIYDLPIAFWETGKKLLSEEADRLPEWAITLGGGIDDSEEKLERKTNELQLADIIITPGKFVYDSIPAWASSKEIHISHFGSPSSSPDDKNTSLKESNRPLRVLFAGSMGQRKGLGDLFSAVKYLSNPAIELVVMGSLLAPMDFYRNQLNNFKYEEGRPHAEVLKLMRTCDVFCLPSIVEGRALVIQEAMSQGLPIIITGNCGGEDLVIEGKTGFLVPIRSPEAIAEKLNWFIENRLRIPEMGNHAKEHAAQYTWDAYGSSITKKIASLT